MASLYFGNFWDFFFFGNLVSGLQRLVKERENIHCAAVLWVKINKN